MVKQQRHAAGANTTVSDELSAYITYSKYASYLPDEMRRENWEELVSRDEQMHLEKFADLGDGFAALIKRAFGFVREKRVLPSMRSLQFGGKAVFAHNSRLFNCAVRHIDSIDAFKEVFYLLLCGCGVGLGITDRHLSKMPVVIDEPIYEERIATTHVVEDTIEGWAIALSTLLQSYHFGNALSGRYIKFDYSQIRPKGAKLKTSGGLAPGYEGLEENLEKVRAVLDNCVSNGYLRLRTLDAYDILMFAAEAVLSGGIRRAATSVVFDKHDKLMMKAKSGNWFETNPQRGRSNNSVLLMRNEVTKEEFEEIVNITKEWGEPAFVFADDPDTLFNPCFEISFIPIVDGNCGVQFCNLTTINASAVKSEKDLLDCVWAATFIGTLQASYTDFKFLSPVAKQLTEDEALLGVSMTGMLDRPSIALNPVIQAEAARYALTVNRVVAAAIDINPAARITCIKPEGSSTLVLGTQASGIHPSHSRYMLRRVQANKLDPVYQHFKKYNPQLCEESIFSPTDDVITFPIEVRPHAILKRQLTAVGHLKLVRTTQKNWVKNGMNPFYNKKSISHNVSCTVSVHTKNASQLWKKIKSACTSLHNAKELYEYLRKDDEWEKVIDFLYKYRHDFSAVSLLASTGDKDYAQAPLEAMTTTAEINEFKKLQESFVPVDWKTFVEDKDHTSRSQEAACAGGICEVVF